jgi:hypothetical protein
VRNQWSGVASSTSFSIIQFKAIAGHQTRSFLEVAGHARAHSVSLALTRYSGHIGRKAGRHGRFATSSESERSVVIRPRPDFESDAFNRARPPLRESFQRYVGRFPLALYFPPAGLDGFPKFPSTSSMVGPPTSHRSSRQPRPNGLVRGGRNAAPHRAFAIHRVPGRYVSLPQRPRDGK